MTEKIVKEEPKEEVTESKILGFEKKVFIKWVVIIVVLAVSAYIIYNKFIKK